MRSKKREEEGRRGKKREEEGRRGKKREEEGRRGKDGSEVKVVKIGKGRGLPIDGERP